MHTFHPAYGSERYANVVRSVRGLVGFWRLDEGSGTVARDQTGTRNGTYALSPTRLKAVAGRPNAFGAGFNGVTSNVQVTSAAAYSPPTTGSMSWMCWTKPNDGGHTHVFSKGTTSQYEWALMRGVLPFPTAGTGFVTYMWQAGGNFYVQAETGTGVVPNGVWCHVVVTLTIGSALRLYVNGIQRGVSTTFVGSMTANSAQVRVGARADGQRFYNGDVADFAIWNRALTAGEAMSLYVEGLRP